MRISMKILERKLVEMQQFQKELEIELEKERQKFKALNEPLDHRISKLERMIWGGVKGYEGLLFRITFLEKQLRVEKLIEPIKKETGWLRAVIKKEREEGRRTASFRGEPYKDNEKVVFLSKILNQINK